MDSVSHRHPESPPITNSSWPLLWLFRRMHSRPPCQRIYSNAVLSSTANSIIGMSIQSEVWSLNCHQIVIQLQRPVQHTLKIQTVINPHFHGCTVSQSNNHTQQQTLHLLVFKACHFFPLVIPAVVYCRRFSISDSSSGVLPGSLSCSSCCDVVYLHVRVETLSTS